MISLRLQILFAVFIALLVGMNLLGGKIIGIFGISASVAIFMMPFSFLITDVVEEVYGRKVVNQFIISGMISLVVIFSFVWLFVYLEPHSRYSFNEEYKIVFASSIRMVLASLAAFLFSQLHDAIAFEWWKKKTNGKALWLRNNLSTTVSQLIDSFVFMMIAFYQITPQFTFAFVISLAIPYYLFKVIFAVASTPMVYLGVRWLRNQESDKQTSQV